MPYFQHQGNQIYYEVYGEGRPILLLNGIMMSALSWAEYVEPLSAHNRLILMDFLDQGKSERLTGRVLTQEMQVEATVALLDHLSLPSVSVVGYSYGGEIALQLAAREPRRVERMCLFNTTAVTRPWLRDVGNGWNAAAGDGESFYLATMPIIYAPSFYNTRYDWMEQRRELLRPLFHSPQFRDSMIRLTDSAATHDVRDKLPEIRTPTLVVSAQYDQLIPIEEQRCLAERLPNSYYMVIPDCGHASMYERPVLFATLILGFVNNDKLDYRFF